MFCHRPACYKNVHYCYNERYPIPFSLLRINHCVLKCVLFVMKMVLLTIYARQRLPS